MDKNQVLSKLSTRLKEEKAEIVDKTEFALSTEDLSAMVDLREAHYGMTRNCDKCESIQAQIMGYTSTQAHWRCRSCRYCWTTTLPSASLNTDEKPSKVLTPEQRRHRNKKSREAFFRNNPNIYIEVLGDLRELFPHVFNYRTPLAIGIYHQIKNQSEIKSRELTYFLNRYCKSEHYLANLKRGNIRYNLLGQPDGVVTEDEASTAIHQALAKEFRRLDNQS